MKKSILLVFAILLYSGSIVHAQNPKYEKKIIQADAAYEIGDYKKSLKYLEKNKKKITKKLGASNEYIARTLLKEAKSKVALGEVLVVPNLISKGLETSKNVSGEQSLAYAKNNLTAAKVWIEYGHLNNAQSRLETVKSVLEALGQEQKGLEVEINLNLAKVYTGKGFYNESLKLIEEQVEYIMGRAVRKVTEVDGSGNLKTTKLSTEEFQDRAKTAAQLLTLKAYTTGKLGEVQEADNQFRYASDWIDKNLSKNDITYLENDFYLASMFDENQAGTGEAFFIKNYERVNRNIVKKATPTHLLNTKTQHNLIRAYDRENQTANRKRQAAEFEKLIKGYFGRQNIHFLKYDALELDLKLSNNRTRNLQGKATSILANTNVLPKDHPFRIELNDFVYDALISNEDIAPAKYYLDRNLELAKEIYGESSLIYGFAQIRQANHALKFLDNLPLANELYQKYFFDLVEKEITPGHTEYLSIMSSLAELYVALDQYSNADNVLDKALDAARRKFDNKDIEYAKALNKIAQLQIQIGEYEEASTNINQALEIFANEKGKENNVFHAELYETNARLLAIRALYDEAEAALSKADKLFRKADKLSSGKAISTSEVDLIKLYIDIGSFSVANELIDEAILDTEQKYGKKSRKLINLLIEKSRLDLINGDYTDAEKTARRASDISLEIYGPNSTKTSQTYEVLGAVYTAIGDYEKAEDNALKTIEIKKEQFAKDHIDVAKNLSQLALIKYHKEDPASQIEDLYLDAKEIIIEKLGYQSPLLAQTLKDLAALYIRSGRTDEAFNLLDQSQRIWENRLGRRNNVNLAGIYVLKGDIHYYQYNYQLAQEKYEDARKVYRKVFNESHPNYVKVISKLSKVDYMQGDKKKSRRYIEEALLNYNNFIKNYFPALSEREKAKFWNTIKSDFEFYNTLAVELAESDDEILENIYNNAITTKAILLNSSIKMRERIVNSDDEELKAKFAQWLSQKELLTNIISMSEEQLIENGVNRNAIESEVELLEKELSEKSELFAESFEDQVLTWENVKQALKPNEVALEMIRFRHFDHVFTDSVQYALLFLKNEKNAEPELVLLNNGYELENKYLGGYKNSIKFKLRDRFSYNQYWKPIADQIGSSATLFLSADGVFNQINLEAIPTGRDSYVLDNSNIILVSNTKDIYLNRKKIEQEPEENKAILFGNPDFYVSADQNTRRTISQLPGTQLEIEQLKGLLNQKDYSIKDYLSVEASEEAIKQVNNPKIFHIATHGFFTPTAEVKENLDNIELSEAEAAENPLLRTGLLLSGAGDLLNKTDFNYNIESGILTAYEAMNLNLDYTDLVVLSACETGLGDLAIGEGVYGLQRAFLVAGAKNLIMSLFKVSDEATQKLMVKFYQKWLETGDKRNSFIEAKKEIRNEYQEPIFWGPFIMMGMDE
ncbi:MAG: CHAT domain-containing protein [Bacteroidota bacterium]